MTVFGSFRLRIADENPFSHRNKHRFACAEIMSSRYEGKGKGMRREEVGGRRGGLRIFGSGVREDSEGDGI